MDKDSAHLINLKPTTGYGSDDPDWKYKHVKCPKPWVGLTDEEINSIDFPESGTATMRDFIRIIEAKLKEKNCG